MLIISAAVSIRYLASFCLAPFGVRLLIHSGPLEMLNYIALQVITEIRYSTFKLQLTIEVNDSPRTVVKIVAKTASVLMQQSLTVSEFKNWPITTDTLKGSLLLDAQDLAVAIPSKWKKMGDPFKLPVDSKPLKLGNGRTVELQGLEVTERGCIVTGTWNHDVDWRSRND